MINEINHERGWIRSLISLLCDFFVFLLFPLLFFSFGHLIYNCQLCLTCTLHLILGKTFHSLQLTINIALLHVNYTKWILLCMSFFLSFIIQLSHVLRVIISLMRWYDTILWTCKFLKGRNRLLYLLQSLLFTKDLFYSCVRIDVCVSIWHPRVSRKGG